MTVYVDVGNTLRGGLRTGIQRVVRALAFHLASREPHATRLIAYDTAAESYFALRKAETIRTADSLADVGRAERDYFDFRAFGAGDIFFEPDSSWTEPLNRGALFRLLKQKGVIVVVLNHDVIPVILPGVCHPNTLVSFSEAIADHLQYADYALATSGGVKRDLEETSRRFLGRLMTSRLITLGADFEPARRSDESAATNENARFPELKGLRYLLSVGTIEPRKNHALLLHAFDRLEAKDAGLVIVGRKGWMSDSFLAALEAHKDFGRRIFWFREIDDDALVALYRGAYAAVLPSQYEGYGLPAVEALRQGVPTIVSDRGSLPEVTGGHAALFKSDDTEALHAILEQLYRDAQYHAALKARAASFRATSWQEAGESVASALEDIATGASHDFGAPLRQIVYLATQPDILDLSLRSVRANLPFVDRAVVLTKPEAHEAVAAVTKRHFAEALVLSDAEVAGGVLPADHQARNTWLRKCLYAHDAIEPNFLASDEDYFALRPLTPSYYLEDGRHVGRYFLDDMGGWLAGSPVNSSYDHGIRNACRVLREAGYQARGFSSHMPQIVNKSLARQIFERFVPDRSAPGFDEWSLYFNVASQLNPRRFEIEPYATLGWPMRTGDWLPQVSPHAPAFENYYRENYAPDGLFAGLEPLGNLASKTERTFAALARARKVEEQGGLEHSPGVLALVIGDRGIKFVSSGTILAGKANVRRILLVNAAMAGDVLGGQLDMFVTEAGGAPLGGESALLGEVTWLPLLPPERPGLYPIRFFAALPGGRKLEARGLLTVIGDNSGT